MMLIHIILCLLFLVCIIYSQTIPESSSVCVEGLPDGNGLFDDLTDYWLSLGTYISVIDSTWVISQSSSPTSLNDDTVYTYCISSPPGGTYTPTIDEKGLPTDCKEWSLNSIVVESGDICTSFDTSFSWIDYVIMGFVGFVFLWLLCMIPFSFCPFRQYCLSNTYQACQIETYENILSLHGINGKAQRSQKDKRTFAQLLLISDLTMDKVVWHNNYFIDLCLYFRMQHPFFGLFYGHKLHPFSLVERRWTLVERRWTLVGALCMAIGIASIIIYIVALEFTDLTTEEQFAIGFAFDLLFGIILSFIDYLFELVATCQCVEYAGPKTRLCFHSIGHLVMILLIIICASFGLFWGIYTSYTVSNLPSTDFGAAIGVFFVNFFTGLFLSWFLLDLISMFISFDNEWRRQTDSKQYCPQCYNDLSCCCIISWSLGLLCCVPCCCYNPCCKPKHEYKEYPKDLNNNIIGNLDGLFAITSNDFENYIKNKPIIKRQNINNFDKFAKDVNMNNDNWKHDEYMKNNNNVDDNCIEITVGTNNNNNSVKLNDEQLAVGINCTNNVNGVNCI